MHDRSWRERAACRGTDVELFYSERHADIDRALAICAHCDVRRACYEQAMAGREVFGVWGGTDERHRRRLFRSAHRRKDASGPRGVKGARAHMPATRSVSQVSRAQDPFPVKAARMIGQAPRGPLTRE